MAARLRRSDGDAEHGVEDVVVDDAAPAPAVAAPDGAARQGLVQPRGVRGEEAVQGGAGLGQVARQRQPEAVRRREVEHLHQPPRRNERQQVEPHRSFTSSQQQSRRRRAHLCSLLGNN